VQPRTISTDMNQPVATDFTGACAAVAAMVFGTALPTSSSTGDRRQGPRGLQHGRGADGRSEHGVQVQDGDGRTSCCEVRCPAWFGSAYRSSSTSRPACDKRGSVRLARRTGPSSADKRSSVGRGGDWKLKTARVLVPRHPVHYLFQDTYRRTGLRTRRWRSSTTSQVKHGESRSS
jgi:hypothetical protein